MELTDDLLTTEEAMMLLKCDRHRLWRLRKSGAISRDCYMRMGNRPQCELRYSYKKLIQRLMLNEEEQWEFAKARTIARKEAEKRDE